MGKYARVTVIPDDENDSSRRGKRAADSGKNSRHSDGGREQSKTQPKIDKLKEQKQNATRKEQRAIQKKIDNMTKDAATKKRGNEHGTRRK